MEKNTPQKDKKRTKRQKKEQKDFFYVPSEESTGCPVPSSKKIDAGFAG